MVSQSVVSVSEVVQDSRVVSYPCNKIIAKMSFSVHSITMCCRCLVNSILAYFYPIYGLGDITDNIIVKILH